MKSYIEAKGLGGHNQIFPICKEVVNRYLKRLFVKVLGERVTLGGAHTHAVKMYDYRHVSACYWSSKYKDIHTFLYRFGWKDLKMYHHYTKLLGMQDTISENDLLEPDARTTLERDLEQALKFKELLQEQVDSQARVLSEIDRKNENMNRILQYLLSKVGELDPGAKSDLKELERSITFPRQ